MFVVTCHIRVKPEDAAEYERVTSEVAVKSRANEPGLVFYSQTRSREEPGLYLAVEIYQTESDWHAHTQAPYFQQAFPRIAELVGGQFDMKQYDTVD